MSSSGETPAELISDFQTTYSYNLTFLGAVAWLVWEYVITLDREVALVWRRKINSASVIFFLNRYIMLVQFAVQLPLSFAISDESCVVLNRILAIFSIAPYFVWAAFSALRAYAMSNRTWPIAILAYLLSITAAGYNIYNFSRIVPINLPAPIFCIPTFPGITPTFIDHWTTATRVCLIVADALVIGVTWWRTFRFRVAAAAANVRTSFLQLLLRDGTVYFVILLILNILQIVVRITAQANFITTFEEPLTVILISRFLMNLRAVDSAARDSAPCGGPASGASSDPAAAVDTALDFADRSHFTGGTSTSGSGSGSGSGSRRFVDSFVSPLGAQLDHDLLFASDEFGVRAEDAGTEGRDVGREKEGTVGDVLVEWVDAERMLETLPVV